jgi:phenylpropionate dioxygenase-like ring-hydroxylating dioxygenase large terminal subunit
MTLFDTTAFNEPFPEIGIGSVRDWYRSPTVLEAERARLFARSWSVVGTTDELAAPGDFLTATVGGVPLLVVRGDDGVTRGFHNLCRHRGIPVIDGSGHTGRYLTCPYHQWSYRRDGSLATVPQQQAEFPDLDLATLPLLPAAVEEWAGIVFARPTAEGPSLAESFSGLDDRLAGFAALDLVEVAKVTYEAACNWKMLVENHVDVYHLWFLHQHSLADLDHRQFAWDSLGNNWWSQEPHLDRDVAPTGLVGLSDADQQSIGAHLLFPNVMIVTCGAYLATYDAVPVTPERTRLTLRVRANPDADGDAMVKNISRFLSEDLEACESLQRATGSPAFRFGATARTHEAPVRSFHAAVRRALGSG